MIKCAREGCNEEFVAATHNQKFHNSECCRIATNQRIMQKYYAKRDQKAGKVRYCKKCKTTRLSRYNDLDICGSCQTATITAANNAVAHMLSSVSWQA